MKQLIAILSLFLCLTAEAATYNVTNDWRHYGAGHSIVAGDTVQLWGTCYDSGTSNYDSQMTNTLMLSNSGTAVNPITFRFMPNAKMICPRFPNWGGAIDLHSQSYIIIDGGSNGIIENTNCGSLMLSSDNSVGIDGYNNYASGLSSNILIENLTITNIYVMAFPQVTNDYSRVGSAISLYGNNVSISNCWLSDGDDVVGLTGPPIGETWSNAFLLSCHIYNFNHGFQYGPGSSNSVWTNIICRGNYFNAGKLWADGFNDYHTDCIHVFSGDTNPTCRLDGQYIYNNTFGPDFNSVSAGNTAAFFSDLQNPRWQSHNQFILNNLFLMTSTNSWGNGCVVGRGSNVWIVNNTAIGVFTNGGWTGGVFLAAGTNCFCYNNINIGSGSSIRSLVSNDSDITNNITNQIYLLTNYCEQIWSDYNVFPYDPAPGFGVSIWGDDNVALYVNAHFDPLTNWQTWNHNSELWPTNFAYGIPNWNYAHADFRSTTNPPLFVGSSFVLATNDTAAKGMGTNLTSLLASQCPQALFDASGTPRPSTGAWDIGAYQSGAQASNVVYIYLR